jgi:hypothetical protein
MAREILSKRNFFDFESPDSAISRFPMTLKKSMASLHQGPKVSNANVNLLIFLLFCCYPFSIGIGYQLPVKSQKLSASSSMYN